ncbi:MAG: hypothetical protein M3Y86_13380 [Verrucomicrobiota bacterium]|nr:hypothetical protein [Verrucomicrobiota bacterium]
MGIFRLSSASLIFVVATSVLIAAVRDCYSGCQPTAYYYGTDGSIYDPRYSATCNWNDPYRGPDQTLAEPIGSTTAQATTSVALAGAIASFKVAGKEYISSGGHGTALNWSFYPQSYDVPAVGECYNPTLSGTQGDDTQAGWNRLPYHGPSTSAILQALGAAPAGQLFTRSRMAFYVPAGETGFGGCVASYPNRSPYNVTYNGNLSPFIVEQTATFGCQTSTAGWISNVLNIEGKVIVSEENHPAPYQLKSIVYMQNDFDTYYKYDPATDYAEPLSLSSYTGPYPSPVGSSSTPIIVSTPDGAYALD